MAIQVLPQYAGGAETGQALGQGLSGGLQLLAQDRLAQLQQRRQLTQQQQLAEQQRERVKTGLSSLFGPAQAEVYSQLPESILAPLVKQKLAEPSQQAYAQALSSLLGGQQPTSLEGLTAPQAQQLTNLTLQKQQADEARKLREQQALVNEQSKRAAAQSRQQSIINQSNKPYLERLSKGVTLAENIKDKAQQMLSLLDSGKVSSGVSGYLPGVIQSPETQQFDALANELASLIAGNSGTATNFKIKTAQSYKPNITQRPETQRALLNDLLKKSNHIIVEDELKNYLVLKNQGEQPKNIDAQVKKLQALYDRLPSATEYDEGTVLEDKGFRVKLENGRWVPFVEETE